MYVCPVNLVWYVSSFHYKEQVSVGSILSLSFSENTLSKYHIIREKDFFFRSVLFENRHLPYNDNIKDTFISLTEFVTDFFTRTFSTLLCNSLRETCPHPLFTTKTKSHPYQQDQGPIRTVDPSIMDSLFLSNPFWSSCDS